MNRLLTLEEFKKEFSERLKIALLPKITIARNFRGDAVWRCTGIPPAERKEIYSTGRTPVEAYENWVEDCKFPF